MKWTRRRLLQYGGLASAGLMALRAWASSPMAMDAAMKQAMARKSHAARAKTMDALKLASFVDPLPLPVLQKPLGRRSVAALGAKDAPYYAIHVREIQCKMHRNLPPTTLFGYGATSAPVLFEARSGEGVLIDWINDLPPHHFLPVYPLYPPDPAMENAPPTRISTHLHGARVPSVSDGYPTEWYGPGRSKVDYYPNGQDAAPLWCHDHAMGVSRYNEVAGLMGWYLLRDSVEESLGLPSGRYELPLLIYDRIFKPDGQLYYPNPPDQGAWSEEFLGDAMMVNGKLRPYHEVEPRKYRLRIANTANARFFALSLSNGQSFQVVGTDQGLLSVPVERTMIVLAPAERADLIVDFSHARGQNIVLQNGQFDMMQFRVGNTPVADDSHVPRTLRPVHRIPTSDAVRTRYLTLDEYLGKNGWAMVMLLNHKHWSAPVTEIMKLGTTEIWSLVNLTLETHPIHLHMIRFQILDRRPFSVDDYLSTNTLPLRYMGPAVSPEPQEMGWKDTVQCPPGLVTRIIVPFQPYAGRYLWHCHILEHEANDMMRPYEIRA